VSDDKTIDPVAGLTEGRIVHYVLDDGEHRPAMVVKHWNPGHHDLHTRDCVNLLVFADGSNDNRPGRFGGELLPLHAPIVHRTSVHFSDEKTRGTWHWPERAAVYIPSPVAEALSDQAEFAGVSAGYFGATSQDEKDAG
jgi:hypothetical protein